MRLRFTTLSLLLVVAASTVTSGQDGKALVTGAARAMGTESLRTITFTGSASRAGIGQNVSPDDPWPLTHVRRYTRAVDLDAVTGTLTTVTLRNGSEASATQVVAAGAPWTQQAELWVSTPYPFLKAAAAAANPTLRTETVNGVRYDVVSVVRDNKYKVEGYISDAKMVERVRTWIDNDVMGDMLVEGVFSDYRDVDGVKVPGLTIVKQGGFPTFMGGVKDAKMNEPVSLASAAGPPVAAAATAAPAVTVEKIAEGVHYLKGGSHHSVLVEFADHVTLIEAPQNEARSLALLEQVRKLHPRKPLTQVINTHHHFDHSGGLRTFVDAGAAIVTHQINKPFFERAFKTPRTLNPDRLERSKRPATITAAGEKLVLSDALRTVELHQLKNNTHNTGMLVAFLPKEKLLVEVDMYTPPAPGAPAPAANAPVNPNALALLDNLERLRLDFDTILPLHGATTATRANLYEFTKKKLVPVSELPDRTAPPAGGRGGGPAPAAVDMP